jgi:hypothetical protein
VNLAIGCFGLFAICLGTGATYLALRDGEIAALFMTGYRTESSRKDSPILFWTGIAGYGLIALAGILVIVGSILGL